MAGVPNLKGMTVAQAQQALQGTGYNITNVSAGGQNGITASQAGSDPIYSYTTYPDGSVRIGLQNAVASAAGSPGSVNTVNQSPSNMAADAAQPATAGTATTAPSPAGAPTGGQTGQIPGWATGTGYDNSAAVAQASNGSVTPAGGVAQYQQGQTAAGNALSTFFGSGSGFAPQYRTPYSSPGGPAQQVTSGSAGGTQAQSAAAASGSVT